MAMAKLFSFLKAARLSAELLADTYHVLGQEFVSREQLIGGLISEDELLEIGVSNEALEAIKTVLNDLKVPNIVYVELQNTLRILIRSRLAMSDVFNERWQNLPAGY